MSYKSSNVIPKIEDLGINISDLGYHTRQKIENPFDHLERIKFNESDCKRILDDIILPLWENEDFFHLIFRKLEDSKSPKLKVRRQIQRLVIRLDLYSRIKPKNGYVINPKMYLVYNLLYGPEFAKWLSKARSAMGIISLSNRILVNNLQFIEKINENQFNVKFIEGKRYDYDSLMNERFLIDFEETESDFHWAFKPVESDAQTLSLFREACRRMLEQYKLETIKAADREQYSIWINDSVTQTDNGPAINRTLLRSFVKNKTIDSIMKGPYTKPLTFKRQVVQVDPGNVRDTWQCFPETLFVVKRVSHILKQVLDEIPFSMMCTPDKGMRRRKMLKKKSQFFMFDFKKCGLTVNRTLLNIMAEELDFLYPNKGFKEIYLFNDLKVIDGSVTHSPLRGVGLGNCNEGITLLQCVVGYMMKHRYNIDSIFFNDDGVFCSEEDVRIPFSAILSLFKNLGMIINLEKTMISKCNIFCEDYVTDKEIDYRKLQVTIIPFADIFFKKNICTAKNLYYTLQRSLIGKSSTVKILDSLIRYYGFEFHKMERFLPFEMGGWEYIGRTSVNEVLRFVFDPREYLGREGSIPFMREWMGYLIRRGDLVRTLSKSVKIRYREFIGNPYKDPETILPHSEYVEELFSSLGVSTNSELRESLDNLYNVRGSKNSKPKLLAGFSDKLLKHRKRLWNTFMDIHDRRFILEPLGGHLMIALNFLRENEIIPMNYLPPDFTIIRYNPLLEYKTKKKVISSNFAFRSSEYTRINLNNLGESFLHNKIFKNTKIFSLANEIKKRKKEYILSDVPLKIPKDIYYLPNWLYLFINKKEYAVYIYQLIKIDKYPVYWIELPEETKAFDMALKPIKYIFPSCDKKMRRVLNLSEKKDWQDFVEDVIGSSEFKNKEEFNSLLQVLLESYEDFRRSVDSFQNKRSDISHDYLNEIVIDEDLVELIVGEKSDEDLIEDFDLNVLLDEDLEELSIQDENDFRSDSDQSEFSDPDRDFVRDLNDDLDKHDD